LAGAGALAVHLTLPGLLGTFRSLLTPSRLLAIEQRSASGRLNDYPQVWTLFLQRPLFGLSLGGFDPTRYFYLDNEALMLLLTLGLPGLLLMVWFISTVWRHLWVAARRTVRERNAVTIEAALLASLCSYAVLFTLFDTFSFFPVTGIMLVVAACASATVSSTQPADARIAAVSRVIRQGSRADYGTQKVATSGGRVE
jgi:O-antigen ligase